MDIIRIEIPREVNDMSRGDIGNIWKTFLKLNSDLNRVLSGIGRERLSEEVIHELNRIGENLERIANVEESVNLLRQELEDLKASVDNG